jgi:hypothetical protein
MIRRLTNHVPMLLLLFFAQLAATELEWVSTDVDGGTTPDATGAPLSLALDADSNPHLFYTAAFELPHNYRYATRDTDGGWKVEVVDAYTPKDGTFNADTHLQLDSTGTPHVSDKTNHPKLPNYPLVTPLPPPSPPPPMQVIYTMEGIDPSPCIGCSSCVSCPGIKPPPCCSTDQSCCDGGQWGELWYATRSTQGNWDKVLIDRGYRTNSTDVRGSFVLVFLCSRIGT